MQFVPKTVLGLFDSSQKRYIIPVYQRAYSWEKEQWKALIDDIKEQIAGENNYFLGNLLLEVIRKDIEYEVIDGQQRLTTIVIFLSALIDVIENKKINDFDISEKRKIYQKNNTNIKIRPVDYDRPFFDAFIISKNQDIKTNSVSQKRIKGAYEYFYKEFQKEKDSVLISIFEKLETSEITCVEIDEKKDSALMFELQNNRGKDLTNMEKLKSYLIYQMYSLSKAEDTNDNIENTSTFFKQIYLLVNDLTTISEDSVLIYHCQAYINGYSYRTIDDIKDSYKKKKSIEWINSFVEELYSSFITIKKIEKSKSKYWHLLGKLRKPAFIYPFIIKGGKYFGDDEEKMEKLLHILEVLSFRYSLINSRADFLSRMNELLIQFNGNVDDLCIKVKEKLNTTYYWGDARVLEYLNAPIYGNSMLNYILWQYEDSIQISGYNSGTVKIENEQIEHISPQTPTDGVPLESGYELNEQGQYPENYYKYIHSIGNLVIISGSHNSSIGNVKFKNKLNSYDENPLLKQQKEIKTFISGTKDEPKWDSDAIQRRRDRIIQYCIERWSFNF